MDFFRLQADVEPAEKPPAPLLGKCFPCKAENVPVSPALTLDRRHDGLRPLTLSICQDCSRRAARIERRRTLRSMLDMDGWDVWEYLGVPEPH